MTMNYSKVQLVLFIYQKELQIRTHKFDPFESKVSTATVPQSFFKNASRPITNDAVL